MSAGADTRRILNEAHLLVEEHQNCLLRESGWVYSSDNPSRLMLWSKTFPPSVRMGWPGGAYACPGGKEAVAIQSGWERFYDDGMNTLSAWSELSRYHSIRREVHMTTGER